MLDFERFLVSFFERLHYDAKSGAFTWRVSAPGIKAGATAGTVTRAGYRVIKVGRIQYRANRLAWFLSFGAWPTGEVDHINGDKLDNRLANLRDVDRATNSQNQRRAHRDNRSAGLLGVTWNKQHGKFQSKLQVRKRRIHVGYFDDPVAAHQAYLTAKAQFHGVGGSN